MAHVKNIGTDTYEVSDFLKSMPHVACTVQFDAGTARVIARSGTCERTYDQRAIQAVQSFLIAGMVE